MISSPLLRNFKNINRLILNSYKLQPHTKLLHFTGLKGAHLLHRNLSKYNLYNELQSTNCILKNRFLLSKRMYSRRKDGISNNNNQNNKNSGSGDGSDSAFRCPECDSDRLELCFEDPEYVKCKVCQMSFHYQDFDNLKTASTKNKLNLPSPLQINKFLDEFVIGQDFPKKVLSVAMYNHYKKIIHNLNSEEKWLWKKNKKQLSFFPNDIIQQKQKNNVLLSKLKLNTDKHRATKQLSSDQIFKNEQLVNPNHSNNSSTNNFTNPQKHPAIQTFPNSIIKPLKHPHDKQDPLNNFNNINQNKSVLEKSNIMLVGPTGSGKTYMVKTLARLLDVPFAMSDCTSLTQAGYVGEDVESVVLRLLQAADHDVEKAQRGIIYLDEIDKICSLKVMGHMRDVGGEGVQQGLLKLLEGTTMTVPEARSSKFRETLHLDTSNILFIASGAFDGMTRIVKDRKEIKLMGFEAVASKDKNSSQTAGKDSCVTEDWLLQQVESRDLVKFGMIPEFVGRFPVIVPFLHLDCSILTQILTKPKDALVNQYRLLFQMDNIKLHFTNGALKAISETALKKQIGARGLRSVLEQILLGPMFQSPHSDITEVVITEGVVLNGDLPTYVRRGEEAVLVDAESLSPSSIASLTPVEELGFKELGVYSGLKGSSSGDSDIQR